MKTAKRESKLSRLIDHFGWYDTFDWVIFATISLMVIFVAVGIINILGIATNHNTDPRNGIVYLDGSVTKQCDGRNLIYSNDNGGVTVTKDSQECLGLGQ